MDKELLNLLADAAGATNEELARLVGLTARQIRHYRGGQRRIPEGVAKALIGALVPRAMKHTGRRLMELSHRLGALHGLAEGVECD